jgi:hypothetical protein
MRRPPSCRRFRATLDYSNRTCIIVIDRPRIVSPSRASIGFYLSDRPLPLTWRGKHLLASVAWHERRRRRRRGSCFQDCMAVAKKAMVGSWHRRTHAWRVYHRSRARERLRTAGRPAYWFCLPGSDFACNLYLPITIRLFVAEVYGGVRGRSHAGVSLGTFASFVSRVCVIFLWSVLVKGLFDGFGSLFHVYALLFSVPKMDGSTTLTVEVAE